MDEHGVSHQALSNRIHFGKFIAEAKFQANRELYSKLIAARDAGGLMEEVSPLLYYMARFFPLFYLMEQTALVE